MTKTLTVEGPVTAVDTATNLSTQGSVTSPSLVLPSGVTKIDKVIVAAAVDLSAAGRTSFLIRLGGNAVLGGEQTLTVGAAGGQLPQAGSDTAPKAVLTFVLDDADITVKRDTIRVQAEMMSQDLGAAEVVVTLVLA